MLLNRIYSVSTYKYEGKESAMKRIFCMMLSAALLIGCFGANAFAEEVSYPMVTHNRTSTEDSASDDWSVCQRGTYLGSGTCSMVKEDASHINISGGTTATRVCDEVTLILYVERSKNYSTGYSTYKTYEFTEKEVYQVAREISNISVEKGYYYRVAGVHSVLEGGTRETTDSVTDPIHFPK